MNLEDYHLKFIEWFKEDTMAYGRKMSRKASKRNFKKGSRIKKKNFRRNVGRGGGRL